tara:strand:- start:615 stop:1526 length:912 start_codon:yes stop_codon:yes gene_type:complete
MDVNLTSISNLPQNSYNFINNFGSNPLVLLVLIGVIILYYIFFAFLGHSNSGEDVSLINKNNTNIVIIEALLWGLFIVLILLNGITYFFNVDIGASMKNIFSQTPEISVSVDNSIGDMGSNSTNINNNNDISNNDISNNGIGNNLTLSGEQVFNIPGNNYTYEDAKALCKAYDAKLASYHEIYDAYKKGANWCNYGWSKDQMAFFPTQKHVWKKLQKIKGHEHDCGRIGINGGYIANPNVRFGVNCYGNKPAITSKESKLMNNQTLYPKSLEDYEIDKKASEYKKNLKNILVSPFNNNNWSKI